MKKLLVSLIVILFVIPSYALMSASEAYSKTIVKRAILFGEESLLLKCTKEINKSINNTHTEAFVPIAGFDDKVVNKVINILENKGYKVEKYFSRYFGREIYISWDKKEE